MPRLVLPSVRQDPHRNLSAVRRSGLVLPMIVLTCYLPTFWNMTLSRNTSSVEGCAFQHNRWPEPCLYTTSLRGSTTKAPGGRQSNRSGSERCGVEQSVRQENRIAALQCWPRVEDIVC